MIYLYTYLADIFIQIDLQMKTIEAFKTNKIWIFLFIFLYWQPCSWSSV